MNSSPDERAMISFERLESLLDRSVVHVLTQRQLRQTIFRLSFEKLQYRQVHFFRYGFVIFLSLVSIEVENDVDAETVVGVSVVC